MIVLRSYSPFPPGGFIYDQPCPACPGGIMSFTNSGLSINQQAELVLKFRQGNNLPGAKLEQVIQDISIYTCIRLGGMSQWCQDSDAPVRAMIGNSGGSCATCGRAVG
jgi:hypothetical protein